MPKKDVFVSNCLILILRSFRSSWESHVSKILTFGFRANFRFCCVLSRYISLHKQPIKAQDTNWSLWPNKGLTKLFNFFQNFWFEALYYSWTLGARLGCCSIKIHNYEDNKHGPYSTVAYTTSSPYTSSTPYYKCGLKFPLKIIFSRKSAF